MSEVSLKIAIISDVHITDKQDSAWELFQRFLKKQEHLLPDKIILLGDIFDVLAGDGSYYLGRFYEIFGQMASLAHSGIRFIYVEGNHDLHLEKLFKRITKFYGLEDGWVKVYAKHYHLVDHSFNLFFAHGDELEGNEDYLRYKRVIRSLGVKLLVDIFLPSRLVEYVGRKASKKSRGQNYLKYSSEDEQIKIKNRFRQIAEQLWEKYDLVFLGHSHLLDCFHKGDKAYWNNGYFPDTQQFVFYCNGTVEFCSLKQKSLSTD